MSRRNAVLEVTLIAFPQSAFISTTGRLLDLVDHHGLDVEAVLL